MKKIIILVALVLVQVSFGQEEEVQDTKKRANEVGIEFLGLIDGQTLITYERSFGKHFTGLIGAGIWLLIILLQSFSLLWIAVTIITMLGLRE